MENNETLDRILTLLVNNGVDIDNCELQDVLDYLEEFSQTDLEAKYLYGGFLLNSSNNPGDIEKGIGLIMEAAEQGYYEAEELLSNSSNEDDIAKPVFSDELVKRAGNGEAQAQVELGAIYLTGSGVELDEKRGFELIEKAAIQNYDAAYASLAFCYENGVGTEKDILKAIQWYEKSASKENADVQYRLGNIYLEEFSGDDAMHKRGLHWLKRAADNGLQKASNYYYFNCYIDKAIADGRISDDADMFEKMGFVSEQADNGDEEAQKCFGF